jgi:uncharacterized repeat protein (TIGR03803 family)
LRGNADRCGTHAYNASQRHEGWLVIAKKYDDGGFSGGNMNRPALKQLLDDIAARLVDTVVVYKVDRLTRSLTDFAKIVEAFDQKGVSFVSVTQQFNTTSSMGRLTLNVLLSFAQFEREVTGERIRDKIAASKKKEDGGACQSCGIVYELTPSQSGWRGQALHEFQMNGDGTQPFGGVVADTAGNLYGVTEFGGVYDQGTVYELSPSGAGWTETILHSFNANGIDGYRPVGGLVMDALGNIYGGTQGGGSNNQGAAFMLSPVLGDWNYAVLYSFIAGPGSDGPFVGPKDKFTIDTAGNLYGTTFTDGTYDCGSVFELSPSEDGMWNYTSLHDFTCGSDGAAPVSTVTFDTEGNMYGTTAGGGNYSDCDGGCGVIWKIAP